MDCSVGTASRLWVGRNRNCKSIPEKKKSDGFFFSPHGADQTPINWVWGLNAMTKRSKYKGDFLYSVGLKNVCSLGVTPHVKPGLMFSFC
jgi:hypothetical protein